MYEHFCELDRITNFASIHEETQNSGPITPNKKGSKVHVIEDCIYLMLRSMQLRFIAQSVLGWQ